MSIQNWEVWCYIGGLHSDRDIVLGIVVSLLSIYVKKKIWENTYKHLYNQSTNTRYKCNSVRYKDLIWGKARSINLNEMCTIYSLFPRCSVKETWFNKHSLKTSFASQENMVFYGCSLLEKRNDFVVFTWLSSMLFQLELNPNKEAGVFMRALINKSEVYEYISKREIQSWASQDKLKLRAIFPLSVVLTLWPNWKLGNNSQPLPKHKHRITDPLNKRQTSPDRQHNKYGRRNLTETEQCEAIHLKTEPIWLREVTATAHVSLRSRCLLSSGCSSCQKTNETHGRFANQHTAAFLRTSKCLLTYFKTSVF